MTPKDDRPGLLSKVAKFVRNPTKDWSELDNPDQLQDSGYDKLALKAMIERKRQNDFVRKREFDQLRKLRNRDPVATTTMARPSFFQSSVATDQDGRAVTLKKIDEIEAQMSRQWWKGKQETAAKANDAAARNSRYAGDSGGLSRSDGQSLGASQFTTEAPTQSPHHFATTVAVGMSDLSQAEFVPTQVPSERMSSSGYLADAYAAPGMSGDDRSFSASELFAMDVDEMTTDPELEEAAIRFANGDDAGAEKGLLEALRSDAPDPDVALSWAAALLDLYRVTHNRSRFDSAVKEFGARFGNVPPVWAPPWGGAHAGSLASAAADPGAAIWQSPVTLDAGAMEALRDALSFHPTPWHIGWGALENIASEAIPLLDAWFVSLCAEPVAVRFSGADTLLQRLRALAPSGDRTVERIRWDVRLNAMRVMNRIDDFELAALDYCVTYEAAPPAWEDARCKFSTADAAYGVPPATGGHAEAGGAPELRGDVLGDASQLLSVLAQGVHGAEPLVVSCAHLVRVDFSAAGSILNWVAMRQSAGGQVHFRDVHRLVAAFFRVIGINAHARVFPRPI